MSRQQTSHPPQSGASVTSERIRRLVLDWLAARPEVDARAVSAEQSFESQGLGSIALVTLAAELAAALGRPVPTTLPWAFPTPDSLAGHLGSAAAASSSPAGAPAPAASEPIAVIGLACRFPGAPGIGELWRLLLAGESAIGRVPPDRWRREDLAAAGLEEGFDGALSGAFLPAVDRFEPRFFGISPREAEQMDPQQRLALELAWEALEDAGVPPHGLRQSATGVFVGVIWRDFGDLLRRNRAELTPHSGPGQALDIVANRVSYALGLRGPSLAVDTACSSSLVAVHLACQSLRSGESTLALAGGVSLMLAPETAAALARFGGLSASGESRPFDAGADGYVRGEGGGLCVLKPLSRALRDGDPIRCLIAGSAVNNDGASNGLTAPNPQAQEEVLRQALARSGLGPADVHYVEAHGTGTPLGDPIEARALGAVLGQDRPPESPLLVGSIKSNLGHLEGAAGIAGLIKAALLVERRQVPPSLHFDHPNPQIPFAELGLAVPRTAVPLPPARRAVAGVSSFGWGGTNCHVVIEELRRGAVAPPTPPPTPPTQTSRAAPPASPSPRPLPLPATAAAAAERAGPVFVCAPQGSQWRGMGWELAASEPAFRATFARCDDAFGPLASRSLFADLVRDERDGCWSRCDFVQPLLLAVQVSLAALWRSWGVEPAAVVGHSVGEIAAAHLAGLLALEDAVEVVYHYSRLQARVAALGGIGGRGGMGVVELSPAHLAPWLDAGAHRPTPGPAAPLATVLPERPESLEIAAHNAPGITVVSGGEAAVAALVAGLTASGIRASRIPVDVAAHGRHIEPILGALRDSLAGVRWQAGAIPMVSTLTGEPFTPEGPPGEHFAANLRRPVLFAQAVERLAARGHRLFLQLDPHPILASAIEQTLAGAGCAGVVLPSLRRREGERATMLASLAALGPLVPLDAPPPHLFPLSAHSPEALRELAGAMLAGAGTTAGLRDLCFTVGVRRSHHRHRLAIVASSGEQLGTALAAHLRGEAAAGISAGVVDGERQGVVMVFSGQGAQRPGMALDLYAREAVFRDALDRCAELVQHHAGWSLMAELARPEASSRLGQTELAQPAIFALHIALAALWRAWGVAPAAVVGHSLGEVAAACVAGALTLEDAVRLVLRRGSLMRGAAGRGRMVAVRLPRQEAEAAITAIAGLTGMVSVAADNGPHSTVLSGDGAALERLVGDLEAAGCGCRWLPTEIAFHGPGMAAIGEELERELAFLAPQAAEIPLYSTVTGGAVAPGTLGAAHWGHNAARPVLFRQAVAALRQSFSCFLEIGPHPVLLQPLREALGPAGVALASLRRGMADRESLLRSLGALYVQGSPIDWRALHPGGGRHLPFPLYPWQRERHWPAMGRHRAGSPPPVPPAAPPGDADPHPLIGAMVTSPLFEGTLFAARIGPEAQGFLADHRIRGQAVLPFAAALEMLRAAAAQALGVRPPAAAEVAAAPPPGAARDDGPAALAIEDIVLHSPLLLPDQGWREVQIAVAPAAFGSAALRLFARSEEAEEGRPAAWRLHASAAARLERWEGRPDDRPESEDWRQIESRCGCDSAVPELHARMGGMGLEHGPAFQGLRRLRTGGGEALAWLELPPALHGEAAAYPVHPALLDAALHGVLALLSAPAGAGTPAGTLVPLGARTFSVLRTAAAGWRAHLRLRGWPAPGDEGAPGETWLADVEVRDAADRPVARIGGLTLCWAGADVFRRPQEAPAIGSLYGLEWRPEAPAAQAGEDSARGGWLILGHGAGLGRKLARTLESRGGRCRLLAASELPGLGGAARSASGPEPPATLAADLLALRAAADSLAAPCRGLVHLCALDRLALLDPGERPISAGRAGLASTAGMAAETCAGVVRLVQALARWEPGPPPRLWLVTRGAQVAGEASAPVVPAPAALWGLGRVVARELPELWGGCIDLPPAPTGGEGARDRCPGTPANPAADAAGADAEALATELCRRSGAGAGAVEAALRAGRRLVPHLVRRAAGAEPEAPFAARQDRTYLIAGGTGGLGRTVARWLVARGARSLALLGRSAQREAACQAADEMERMGARVELVRADLAEGKRLAAALGRLRTALPPLAGVVYAAGTADDGMLLGQEPGRFGAALATRVAGAWNLHRAVRDLEEAQGEPVEFFVLFSSLSGLLGWPGQGGYAAANAFLDALAHHRRHQGLPALSISWGPWAGPGMMERLSARERERWAAMGIGSLEPAQGLAGLRWALGPANAAAAQVAIVARGRSGALARGLAGALPELLPVGAFAGLPAAEETGHPAAIPVGGPDVRRAARELAAAPPGARRGLLLAHVAALASEVLGIAPPRRLAQDEKLFDAGLDSMMALELRGKLEASLGTSLRATVVFTHPTVAALVDHLDSRLFGADAPALPVGAPEHRAPPEHRESAVSQMSDEEAEALLEQRLVSLERGDPMHG